MDDEPRRSRHDDRPPVRVIVCGSRDIADFKPIFLLIRDLPYGSTVLHGGCPTGADRIADFFCREMRLDIKVEVFAADWKANGLNAGPIRQQEMVKSGADTCYAFFRTGSRNRGTQGTVTLAERHGIHVVKKWVRE